MNQHLRVIIHLQFGPLSKTRKNAVRSKNKGTSKFVISKEANINGHITS